MSAIFSWLMEGAKRFHYFHLDTCAPQKLKHGSLVKRNPIVDMIYRDISNHQLLQSGGIFETPHVKPEVLSAKKDWISQSETNSLIRRFVDPGIFACSMGTYQRLYAPPKMLATVSGVRLKPLWKRFGRRWVRNSWLWHFGILLCPASENPMTQEASKRTIGTSAHVLVCCQPKRCPMTPKKQVA